MLDETPVALSANELTWKSSDGLELFARSLEPGRPEAGLPVICVPGLTRNSLDFSDSAPWIAARGRRVISVDLRGRGLSARSADPKTYRPDVYVRDIIGLMDDLGLDQAHILGTSLGGIVAMSMAASHPTRLAGAILNDIGPAADPAGLARISSYAGSAPPVGDWAGAARYAAHINGAAFPDYGEADWDVFARRMFREDAAGKPVLDYDPAVFRPVPGWAMRMTSFLLWRYFRKLAADKPVLVLRGALSDVLARSTVKAMHRAAPGIASAEVPRVGHAPDLSEPAAMAALGRYFASVG